MLIIIIRNALKLTSSNHDKQHPNESIIHEKHTPYIEVPSETSNHDHTRTIDRLYTPVPSSSEGSYASQPCGTHRSIPTMLMEIKIQPKTHIE